MIKDIQIKVDRVRQGKAMKWRWALICDGKELAGGIVTGTRDKATKVAQIADARYLEMLVLTTNAAQRASH
jgi:hypothetical protein